MRVRHVAPGDTLATARVLIGPGDLAPVTSGTLFVDGPTPDGGEWVVAFGWAVANGCSVIRRLT